jgi:hypothetical protein
MKQFLFVAVLLGMLFVGRSKAQSYSYGWSFNDYSNGKYPHFWTDADTVKGSAAGYGTDTNKLALHKGYSTGPNNNLNSITFTNTLYLAGQVVPTVTPTVGLALYGSSDNGFTYDPTPLQTFTITPVTSYTVAATDATTPTSKTYIVNPNFGGNPYTDYMWVLYGKTSDTVQWVSGVLFR